MRVASLNVARRQHSVIHKYLPRWLESNAVDVLCLQEAGASGRSGGARIAGYELIEGSDHVAAYRREGLDTGPNALSQRRWQTLSVGYLRVHNLYLSARSSRKREALLREVTRSIASELRETHLVVGDFNLAPSPRDGIVNGRPSRFNTQAERRALATLLKRCNLRDLGASVSNVKFTRAVENNGYEIQFRCDLALLSRSCVDSVRFQQDDCVRAGAEAFTDHSALLIDLPVDPMPPMFRHVPGNTAKPRADPSRVARWIAPAVMAGCQAQSVLDFGCGRGRDVAHYRELGFRAEGYDSHPSHGFATMPDGVFDVVVMTYVLNTLAEPGARTAALLAALRKVRRRGLLIVAIRNWRDVNQDVRARGWARLNDGYLTSQRLGTFVKGMSVNEVLECLPRTIVCEPLAVPLPSVRGTDVVVLRRR